MRGWGRKPSAYSVRAVSGTSFRVVPAGATSVLNGRAAQFLLLTGIATAALYARTAVSPLQEVMRTALGLSDNQMALLQGPALALAPIAFAMWLGLLVDRHSRVRLLLIFAVCNLVGTVLTALAPTFATLFAARCLIGLAHTGTSVAAFSLLADLFRPDERGRASMVVLIGQIVGTSAVFALGGALVARAGVGADAWRHTMLWLAVPLVLIIPLAMAMREPARCGGPIERSPVRQALAGLWGQRRVIAPILGGLVMTEIAMCGVFVWAAPTLSRNFSLSVEHVGSILSASVLAAGVLGSIAGGLLLDRCQRIGGPRLSLLTLAVLSALTVPSGLFPMAPGALSASVLLVIFLMIVDAAVTMTMALLTVVVPNEVRGLCLAAAIGLNTLFGVAVTPLIVSGLSGALGGAAMIGASLAIVCVVAGVLGTVLFALARRTAPLAVTQ